MSNNYESLLEENIQLKKALLSSKLRIQMKEDDYETLREIHEEVKSQLERIKKDNQSLTNKINDTFTEKKELEQQFDTTIRNLKQAIEQKQREIEDLQQKIMPNFDQDMLRIRIINELEIPHRQQLEQKQAENEKLQEQIFQLKRSNDIATAKIESVQMDAQKEKRLDEEKQKREIVELHHQIESLNNELNGNRDREVLRKMRREFDESRQKLNQFEDENEELRQDRDKIREEKNQLMMQYSRQIDQERNDKRHFKSESEKLLVKVRYLEEENRKEKIRRDKLTNELDLTRQEKETGFTETRKKDDTIHYLQRKITEMEEEHLQYDQKLQEQLSRLYNEEHDKYLEERNKATSVLKDLDNLKKKYNEITEDYKLLKDRFQKEQFDLKDDQHRLNDEREKIQRTVTLLQRENADLDRKLRSREEQLGDLQNESESFKRVNRELTAKIYQQEISFQQQLYNSQVQFQQQSSSLNQNNQNFANQQEEKSKTKVKFEDEEIQRSSNKEIVKLKTQNKELKEENQKLNQVKNKLKTKLQEANDKIMELLTKKLATHSQSPSQSPVPQYQQLQKGAMQQYADMASTQNFQQVNQQSVPTFPGGGITLEDDQLLQRIKMITDADDRF